MVPLLGRLRMQINSSTRDANNLVGAVREPPVLDERYLPHTKKPPVREA